MTRCKPGDLAIITREEPGCEANIGRMVHVNGPLALYRRSGQQTWLIMPVDDTEPWLVSNGKGGAYFMRYRDPTIEHPDDWMTPIRPDDLDEDIDEQEDLTREREVVTCK